jgi:hypothetical protein
MAIKKAPPVKGKNPPTKKGSLSKGGPVATKGLSSALKNVKEGQKMESGKMYPFKNKKTEAPKMKKYDSAQDSVSYNKYTKANAGIKAKLPYDQWAKNNKPVR